MTPLITATPCFFVSSMKSFGASLRSLNSIWGMMPDPRRFTFSFSAANCFNKRFQLSPIKSSWPRINCRLISANLSGRGSGATPESETKTLEMSPSFLDGFWVAWLVMHRIDIDARDGSDERDRIVGRSILTGFDVSTEE